MYETDQMDDAASADERKIVSHLLPGEKKRWAMLARMNANGVPGHFAMDANVALYGCSDRGMAVVKLYPQASGINIQRASDAYRLAAAAGVSPPILAVDEANQALAIAHPGNGWRTANGLDLDCPQYLAKWISALRLFHAQPLLGWGPQDQGIAPDGRVLVQPPAGLGIGNWASLVSRIAWIDRCLAAVGSSLTPCHRDVYASNLLVGSDDVLLIDFDHAADADPYSDIGALGLSVCDLPFDFAPLVEIYAGSARVDLVARARLHSIREDFRWGCMALHRHAENLNPPIDFLDYARARLMRCEGFLNRWDLGSLLTDVAR